MANKNTIKTFKFFSLILSLSLLPFLGTAQLKGVAYQKKLFQLDSLLSITHDTSGYLKAIEKIPVNLLLISDVLKAANIFASQLNFDRAMSYAKTAVKNGEEAGTFSYLPEKIITELQTNECSLKSEYINKMPAELIEQIEEVNQVNGRFRGDLYRKIHNYTFSGIDMPDTVTYLIDSLNTNTLLYLITKYGMVTEKKHGALFNKFFSAIMISREKASYELIRKKLYDAVMAAEIPSSKYAYYVDVHELAYNGSQVYGSLFDLETGFKPIKNIEETDKLRAAIGAGTLKSWMLLNQLPLNFLPQGYKNK